MVKKIEVFVVQVIGMGKETTSLQRHLVATYQFM